MPLPLLLCRHRWLCESQRSSWNLAAAACITKSLPGCADIRAPISGTSTARLNDPTNTSPSISAGHNPVVRSPLPGPAQTPVSQNPTARERPRSPALRCSPLRSHQPFAAATLPGCDHCLWCSPFLLLSRFLFGEHLILLTLDPGSIFFSHALSFLRYSLSLPTRSSFHTASVAHGSSQYHSAVAHGSGSAGWARGVK